VHARARVRTVLVPVVTLLLAWAASHFGLSTLLASAPLEVLTRESQESVTASPTREQQLEALGITAESAGEPLDPLAERGAVAELLGQAHPSVHRIIGITCGARQFRTIHAVAVSPTTLVLPGPVEFVGAAVQMRDGTWWTLTPRGSTASGLAVFDVDAAAALVPARFASTPLMGGHVVAVRAPDGQGSFATVVGSRRGSGVIVSPEIDLGDGVIVTTSSGVDVGVLRTVGTRHELVPVGSPESLAAPARPPVDGCNGVVHAPAAQVPLRFVGESDESGTRDALVTLFTALNERSDLALPLLRNLDDPAGALGTFAGSVVWDIEARIDVDAVAPPSSIYRRVERVIELRSVEVDVTGCWSVTDRIALSLPSSSTSWLADREAPFVRAWDPARRSRTACS
jgi:hypothetical protein